MLALGTLAAVAVTTLITATPVDFSLLSAGAPSQAPAEPASPSVMPAPEADGPPRPRPHVPVARGFGNGVLLSFAVRQIVPRGVPVHLGPGVNTSATVNWVGGRSWHRVLAAAVVPLGYRVVVGWHGVTIGR